MRNWNNVKRILKDEKKSTFYITYEELKRVPRLTFFRSKIIPFYITYEELKHKRPTKSFVAHLLFILPMRNWNEHLQLRILFVCRFLYYLWGIETSSHYYHILIQQSFYITYEELKPCLIKFFILKINWLFILPMRNWNRRTWFIIGNESNPFYITYEELKHYR